MFQWIKIQLVRVKIWFEERSLKKELEKELDLQIGSSFNPQSILRNAFNLDDNTQSRIIQEHNQYQYREGIANLKRNVKKIANAKSEKALDKVLRDIDDLMICASHESHDMRLIRKLRESIMVRKGGIDIKSEKDRKKMIEGRVQDYKIKQDDVEKRNLLRKIRRAKKEGKQALLEQLEKEFYEKYGARSNNS